MNKDNKTGADSVIQRTNQWLPERSGGRGEISEEDEEVQTTRCKINKYRM